ncbi:hypothetical protein A3C19_01915 [Candidatus Kaiserbacteria bacterium RIFCSPHIGHO2_02_FULL_54_22]|uniref:Uncharacterized protein n=1 Tax=Candidatus Kaiserbacteria bacterium RIFCSPHIGHO2_02_FULL_54_22 TaxID=1798495 RepID=A0A1F6DNG9_9BACT|nr:MAG: hypothetical protein UY89_C0033G0001 [Parcubacteria group bacterium GW2011_GWA1_54_9]OGG62830.1 MAG: hypothetical protein A3C19_01915 [Candidatus Kaiserbacteria bacterium RIFCSPHIGHO2_02_FULL_54_22]OGG68368.1 MAG: hypothetical protein A3E99_02830 [Candidatus Kaiserbacteria bacterium RIFCSPHIGHO2_12_FULL_54_16]
MYTRHNEINHLFDETIAHLIKLHGPRFREKKIFLEVLGDTPEMRETFFRFLHDVSTCPPEVILWCRRQINTHLSVVK